jgi:hypothetical protein
MSKPRRLYIDETFIKRYIETHYFEFSSSKIYNDKAVCYIKESEHNRLVDELKAEMPKWISVGEMLPNKETDGEKVLLYREMNESQKLMSISVMDTFLVKHCEPSSFWMPLPKPPTK